jgi:hypothetical protein
VLNSPSLHKMSPIKLGVAYSFKNTILTSAEHRTRRHPHSHYNPRIIAMANAPHGGVLKDLLARDAQISEALKEESHSLKDIVLTEVCWVIMELPNTQLSYPCL